MIEHLQNGVLLLNNGEFEKALEELTKYIDSNPQEIKGFYHRGITYRKLDLFNNSLRDFNSALKLKEEDPDLLCDRAITHYHMGNKKAALLDMDLAASIEPNNAFRYSSRAFIKGKFGDVKGAISDYEKAISFDPNDAVSYNNLGLLQEQLGRKQQANQQFDKADALTKNEKYEKNEFAEKIKKESTPISSPKPSSKLREEIKITSKKRKVTTNAYLGTIQKLITSKKERQEFISFIKSLFRRK